MDNREKDALIATQVMGWRFEKYSNGGGFWHRQKDCKRERMSEKCACGGSWVLPHYSTDPAASKQLREKLAEMGWYWSLTRQVGGEFMFEVGKGDSVVIRAYGPTEELAVAECALKLTAKESK